MASVVFTSLKDFTGFLQGHQVSLFNGLLIVFTIGGEQIFKANAFNCPCDHDEAFNYAFIFIFVPALILGILGVAISNLTWRILQGCGKRYEKTATGFGKSSRCLCMVIARAAVVPSAWLFIAFFDGNYFSCMMADKPCEKKILPNGKETDTAEILYYKTMSQNIAWISLAALMLVSFTVICITRCCDNVTYLQYKFLNAYRDAEQDLLDQEIKKCAKEKAGTNVKVFIEKEKEGQVNKASWDEISRIRDPTIPKKESNDEGKILKTHPYIGDYLTPLQEWVHGQIQMNILQDQAPQTNEQKQNLGEQVLQMRDISPV